MHKIRQFFLVFIIGLSLIFNLNLSSAIAINLDNYLADNTQTGTIENISVKTLITFLKLGEGTFKNVDQYSLDFLGKIDFSGISSDLDLVVELTDKDSEALSGTCKITINGVSGNGNYLVNKSSLIMNANIDDIGNQQITINKINSDNQTEINLKGAYNYQIHLTPNN